MPIPKNWLELADDLESLLRGNLNAEKFEKKYKEKWKEGRDRVYDTLAYINHFLADYDIRAKDPQYKKMQEYEMKKLISFLRAGRDINDILKITFLGESNIKV